MPTPQKLRCRVQKITDHGDHVYTVDMLPERPLPRFKPGQFLHLSLDEYDPSSFWPESRVFSIANSPTNRDQIRISYSVRGRFTARMERELEEDRWVWVKLPYGEFIIDHTTDAVIFAGGTGITPFIAFLDSLKPEFKNAVYLAYGARSRSLLIYRSLVERCSKTVKNLSTFYFIEEDSDKQKALMEFDEVIGRISVNTVWPQIQNPHQAIFYISGPPEMVQTISRDLLTLGIGQSAIKIDAWD